jgi:hypothetical protein
LFDSTIGLFDHWFVWPLVCLTIGLFNSRFVQQLVCPTVGLSDSQFVWPLFDSTIGLFDHWFVQQLVCSTIGLFNHWFVQPLVCSTIGLFNHWFVRPLVCSFVRSLMFSTVDSFNFMRYFIRKEGPHRENECSKTSFRFLHIYICIPFSVNRIIDISQLNLSQRKPVEQHLIEVT